MNSLIKVAMVGHTNTGKTSLLRTLTRNVHFGEIANRASTTRHVEGATLMIEGRPMIDFYDTPGLEDSIGLLEHLEHSSDLDDWVARIEQFLHSEAAQHSFAQEAKSLRQVVACDLVLYVIDVREQVLGKYRDELTLLIRTARPVIPLLNFVNSTDARTEEWRQHLIRLGLHASLGFNPLVSDAEAERRLFEKMRALNDILYEPLGRVIDDLDQRRRRLRRIAADLIADLLLDVAAYAPLVDKEDAEAMENTRLAIADRVRQRELRCAYDILREFGFRSEDYTPADLLIDTDDDEHSWLTLASLKHLGIQSSGGIAAGASAGLAADLMVGGLSLGIGTATGAALGALYKLRDQGERVVHYWRGQVELRIGNDSLSQLAARQLTLADSLLKRGHAALQVLQLDKTLLTDYQQQFALARPEVIDQARIKPGWSSLAQQPLASDRDIARERLTTDIEKLLKLPA